MEILRFGPRRHESIPKRVGRFIDQKLEVDIIDTFLVGAALGTAYLLKDYLARNRVRFQNNIARRLENKNILPLNETAQKEAGHIISSKF